MKFAEELSRNYRKNKQLIQPEVALGKAAEKIVRAAKEDLTRQVKFDSVRTAGRLIFAREYVRCSCDVVLDSLTSRGQVRFENAADSRRRCCCVRNRRDARRLYRMIAKLCRREGIRTKMKMKAMCMTGRILFTVTLK